MSRAASGSLHRTTSLDSITSRQAADKIFSRILMIPAMMESFLPLSPPPQAYQSCPRPTLIGTPLRCVCVCVCVCVFSESHKRCQNLPMQSFLLLPMQRITRLPLLILAIFNRTPSTHPEYDLVDLPYDLP